MFSVAMYSTFLEAERHIYLPGTLLAFEIVSNFTIFLSGSYRVYSQAYEQVDGSS